MNDKLRIEGHIFSSRFFMGTAGYPSPDILRRAIENARPGLITVSLRRESRAGNGQKFWSLIGDLGVPVLPNTAGCHGTEEAITTAEMAREVFATNMIKLEVIGDDYTLQPHPMKLLQAAEELIKRGFEIFPYMTDDLVLAQELTNAGCRVLMPWAAPIGSGRGLLRPDALKLLRERFPAPRHILVVDAGIGAPSHAAAAMEIGYDAVLVNTAVARAADPVAMAGAFALAVESGRQAYLAGIIAPQEHATPSTPMIDKPMWHQTSA